MAASATTTGNVHVVIRVRPLSDSAGNAPAPDDDVSPIRWKVKGNQIFEAGGQDDGFNRPPSKPYVFDRIFDSDSTTEQVFNEVALPILAAIMDGYNGTIFAYGQTSSGKTHTMMGNKSNEGLIPRMARALFSRIEKTPTRDFLLRVTCLEIHNEKIYDLMSATKKALNLREDQSGQPFVEELKCVFINNFLDLMETMWHCEGNRSYGATSMNEQSSRSHTIFTVVVESSLPQNDANNAIEGAVRVSHLNLVDLAGSEPAGQMGSTGSRFKEGCLINASLFALRNVISKLTQSDNQFINFRDSKLTRILKASLGGNALTSIICTVKPDQVEETHSTLKFASTAKTMENKPKVNETLSEEAVMKQNARQLQLLLQEREALKKKERVQEEIERELIESNKKNMELEAKILTLKERIIHASTSCLVNVNFKNRRETWAGGLKMKLDDSPDFPDIGPSFDRLTEWQDAVFARENRNCEPLIKCRRLDPQDTMLSDMNPSLVNYCSIECQTDESELLSNKELISHLRWKCRELKGNLMSSEKHFSTFNAEHEEIKDFHNQEHLIIVDLNSKFVEAQNRLKLLDKTAKDAESLYLETNKKYSILVDECDGLRDQVNLLESTNKNLSDREAEFAVAVSQNKQLKEELMSSKKRIDLLENNLKDHDVLSEIQTERHERLVAELRLQLQNVYDLSKTHSEALKDTEDVATNCSFEVASSDRSQTGDEETAKEKELLRQISELELKTAELEGQLDAVNVNCAKHVAEISKFEYKIRRLENLDGLISHEESGIGDTFDVDDENFLKAIIADLDLCNNQRNKERQLCNKLASELLRNLADHKFMKAQLIECQSTADDEVQVLVKSEAKLKREVDELKAQIERGCDHETEMAIVQEDFERREANLRQEILRLYGKMSDSNKMRGNDEKRPCPKCSQLIQANTALNIEIFGLETELSDLKTQQPELKEELEIANQEVERYKGYCDDYHKETEELSAELASVRKQLEAADQIETSKINERLEKLENENDRLRKELSTRIKGGLQESGRNDADKRKLQLDVEKLETLVKLLEKKNLSLKNDLRRLQLEKMETTDLKAPSTANHKCTKCGSIVATNVPHSNDGKNENADRGMQLKAANSDSVGKKIQSPKKATNLTPTFDYAGFGKKSSKENRPTIKRVEFSTPASGGILTSSTTKQELQTKDDFADGNVDDCKAS